MTAFCVFKPTTQTHTHIHANKHTYTHANTHTHVSHRPEHSPIPSPPPTPLLLCIIEAQTRSHVVVPVPAMCAAQAQAAPEAAEETLANLSADVNCRVRAALGGIARISRAFTCTRTIGAIVAAAVLRLLAPARALACGQEARRRQGGHVPVSCRVHVPAHGTDAGRRELWKLVLFSRILITALAFVLLLVLAPSRVGVTLQLDPPQLLLCNALLLLFNLQRLHKRRLLHARVFRRGHQLFLKRAHEACELGLAGVVLRARRLQLSHGEQWTTKETA